MLTGVTMTITTTSVRAVVVLAMQTSLSLHSPCYAMLCVRGSKTAITHSLKQSVYHSLTQFRH